MKKYDILLAIPRYKQYGGHYVLPLGILYVSAALKKAGFHVATLNLNCCASGKDSVKLLQDTISRTGVKVVASGGLSGEFNDLYDFFELVKSISPDITTVCGGGIISASAEIAMEALIHADIGIIGEGENTMCRLLSLTNNLELHSLKGIVFWDKKENKWQNNGSTDEIENLDSLPMPDYEGFCYEEYLTAMNNGYGWKGEILSPVSIIGSRSCPYSCTFCFHPTGYRYRERSLDSIFAEIDYLLGKYGNKINCIALREELFSSNFARIYDFAMRIKQYDVYWTIQLRVNMVNEDVIRILAESGCFAVFIGIESISDEVLTSMNKKITAEQINTVLMWAEKYQLNVRSGLIFGDKAETLETAQRSLEWLQEHRNYNPVLKRPAIIADMLIPFPGTAIYKYVLLNGIIKDEAAYLSQGCPLVNLTQLSNDQYRELIRKVQKISGNLYRFWNGQYIEELIP